MDIRSITKEEALAYYPNISSGIETAIKSVVAHNGKKLIGFAVFSFPSVEFRETHTSQLWKFICNDQKNSAEILSSIIKHYREKHRVSDLIIPSNFSELIIGCAKDLKLESKEIAGSRCLEWINEDRSYYTYKITSVESDKYYYGVRSLNIANATIYECIDDKYMGSGTSDRFKNWKNKHKHSLSKEILAIYNRKADAYKGEADLVGDLWITDPNCLNSMQGGKSSHIKHNQDTHKYDLLTCEVHGESLHSITKKSCLKCSINKVFSKKKCIIHGFSTHRLDKCEKCARSKNDSIKTCIIHDETLHQGDSCYKCAIRKSQKMANCEIHGLTLHSNASCYKCSGDSSFYKDMCKTHGQTAFQGGLCAKCRVRENISTKECSVHGQTVFQGDICARCSASYAIHLGLCPIHGESSFTGNTCNTCRSESSVSERECSEHGLVKHIGDKCRVCVNSKSVNIQTCDTHGETKHQGSKCCKCNSMETAHRRYHGVKPNPRKCKLCILESGSTSSR